MRIGVVTTSYPREPDDPAGSFVAGFTRWLARAHTVEVIAAGPGAEVDGAIVVRRVNAGAGLFYDEGAPERLARSTMARARAPLFTAALAAQVAARARRWDAVVSHWLAPCGLVVATAARGLPHLAIAHSGDVHLLARPRAADGAVALLLSGGHTRIVFAGAHLQGRLVAALAGEPRRRTLLAASTVCPMGIDVAPLLAARAQDRDEARRTLELPPTGPVVAFLGRLVPIKGVDVLIDALHQLGAPAMLLVGGDGPARGPLEAQARALHVPAVFAGELRGARRDALFAAADLLVLPSIDLAGGRTEGTPVVALEALAAGVPLIASDVGGVREAVGDAAVLVPPGDPSALAAALAAHRADPAAAVARAAAGLAAAQSYDWQTVAPRLWRELPTLG